MEYEKSSELHNFFVVKWKRFFLTSAAAAAVQVETNKQILILFHSRRKLDDDAAALKKSRWDIATVISLLNSTFFSLSGVTKSFSSTQP